MIALTLAIAAAGIAYTAKLLIDDGFGRIPTR